MQNYPSNAIMNFARSSKAISSNCSVCNSVKSTDIRYTYSRIQRTSIPDKGSISMHYKWKIPYKCCFRCSLNKLYCSNSIFKEFMHPVNFFLLKVIGKNDKKPEITYLCIWFGMLLKRNHKFSLICVPVRIPIKIWFNIIITLAIRIFAGRCPWNLPIHQ